MNDRLYRLFYGGYESRYYRLGRPRSGDTQDPPDGGGYRMDLVWIFVSALMIVMALVNALASVSSSADTDSAGVISGASMGFFSSTSRPGSRKTSRKGKTEKRRRKNEKKKKKGGGRDFDTLDDAEESASSGIDEELEEDFESDADEEDEGSDLQKYPFSALVFGGWDHHLRRPESIKLQQCVPVWTDGLLWVWVFP